MLRPVGRKMRAFARVIQLCFVTAGYYAVWVLGVPFVFAFPATASRWRARNFRGWASRTARITKLQIRAPNPPPQAPFLLVANHLTYVDIVVLESQVDCIFVAKSEVASWPVLGVICRSLGTIFIDRSQKRDILNVMAKAEQALDKGSGVVLFAEGTSTQGATVAPFKPSLLEFAARRHIPVHYATISYSVPAGEIAAEQSVCWWNETPFLKHIFRLLQLRTFQATVTFGTSPILSEDRHDLAAQLWSAVNEQFKPVTATR